ncbi:hypothetical protein WJX84_002547 [Apatococcus fuscideae]|uniref:ENT domain-containing protein n=1 Tax=Apatococcus fuscideae TaxID=2026836 RepID=A0AAW1SHC6_9CHLO
MADPDECKQQALTAHRAVLRYMVTQPLSWDASQFLNELQKQLAVTPEEHADIMKAAREAHMAEQRGESPAPGPRLSYRASTSLPPAVLPSARPPAALHGGPSQSKKRKSSNPFAAPPSPQIAKLAPRPDPVAVARHGLHEFMGRKVWRHWANEDPDWVEEEWEPFIFAKGKNPKEWRWSTSDPLDPMTLFPPGALNGVHVHRTSTGGKRGRGRGRPSLSQRPSTLELARVPDPALATSARHRFVPLRAPGELDRALAAGSLEDLQDIRDSIASRVADIRAHLEALKPLEDNPGLDELESCQIELKGLSFMEARIQEELMLLPPQPASSDNDF